MHTNLVEKIIARRLRAAADEANEAPYDWAEFQRRRRTRSRPTVLVGRERSLAVAASVVAALLVVAIAMVFSRPQHASPLTAADGVAHNGMNQGGQADASKELGNDRQNPDRLVQARTRALEGWLADLPHDPAVVRVGAHAAVSSLQDQIAALDDLMSVERAAGAQPSRLGALELQREQLVNSLAQLQYAELLASTTP